MDRPRAGYSELDVLARLPPPTMPHARVPLPDLVLFEELLVAVRCGLASGEFVTTLPQDGSGARRVFLGRLTEAGLARLAVARGDALESRARALCHGQCVCGADGEGTRCATPQDCQDWQAWLPHAEAGMVARGATDDAAA